MTLILSSTAEGNQINEAELQNIVQSMSTVGGTKPPGTTEAKVPPAVDRIQKPSAPKEKKSLSEKIREQKERLRQTNPPINTAAKSGSKFKSAAAATRTNYHRGPVVPTKQRERPFNFTRKAPQTKQTAEEQKPVRPRPVVRQTMTTQKKSPAGYSQKHNEKLRRYRQEAATTQRLEGDEQPLQREGEEEPRFDPDDYTKTATAFNPSTSLTQSFFQRAGSLAARGCAEDASFTERLLVDNNMVNVAKRKGMEIPARALSTEERAFSKCTFKPKLYKDKFSGVQPRLMSHYDQAALASANRKVPKNEQLLSTSTLNRSYQSAMFEPCMPMHSSRGSCVGLDTSGNRRSLCNIVRVSNNC